MKRFRRVLIGIGAAAAISLISAGAAAAVTGNKVVSGTTDSSVYKVGQTVTVSGTVNGDIFCAGQTVDVDATVNGDVICAGQTINITGTINGNIRVAGQTVNIGAKTERSVTVAAQDFTLESDSQVGGDLSILGQSANVNGNVARDMHGTAQTMIISGNLGRDVDVSVNQLRLDNGAHIAGDVSYTSHNKLSKSAGAVVGGTISYHTPPKHQHNGWQAPWITHLYVPVTLLVLSMVLVALFPQFFVRFNARAAARPWLALLIGFAAMFLVPVVVIALLATVIGVPLAFMVGLAWVLAFFLSAPLAAFYLGRLALANERRLPLVMLAGAAILGILCLIPVLGWIITVLAIWFGTGSVLLNLQARYERPVYHEK